MRLKNFTVFFLGIHLYYTAYIEEVIQLCSGCKYVYMGNVTIHNYVTMYIYMETIKSTQSYTCQNFNKLSVDKIE